MALPDINTAVDTLQNGVFNEIFFAKCAAAGLIPRTTEEAQQMLDTAEMLGAVQEKQAAEAPSEVADLYSNIRKTASEVGLATKNTDEAAIKQAVDVLANDPRYFNSVLSLALAEMQSK